MEITHIPVLLAEAVEYLNCQANGIYLDATLGSGGHAFTILKDNPEIKALIALDWDEEAIKQARKILQPFSHKTLIFQENFINIRAILKKSGVREVNGILLDLGVSSQQLEDHNRGFSFRLRGPLDMRMNRNLPTTAFDLVNTYSVSQLEQILLNFGEERFASRIARAIVTERKREPISDTLKLSQLVTSAIPPKHHPRKIHPATRTFQALRIAVNNELENLKRVIEEGVDLLAQKGRLCIISFHSIEDRIVKHQFRKLSKGLFYSEGTPPFREMKQGKVKIITKKPIISQPEEIRKNPRARSAKLRVVEKI
ncbi:MAG: hypothetical protein AMJ42_00860 [Deltaproteobacteria bacterium DG_8]|nr:MAG: hypothetical protein AMJ42_00860 [Deltaproteobacteria bacterium DG_8]